MTRRTHRPSDAGTEAQHATRSPVAAPLVGPAALARTLGNQAFATVARVPAVLARAPTAAGEAAVKALAEGKIAPELRAVGEAVRAAPSPTLEGLRKLRSRVVAVRALYDTVPVPAGPAGSNWQESLAETAIGRTLIDGLIAPGSDLPLRLAWGKTLGTCRQLIGLLPAVEPDPAQGQPPPPAPAPNDLPPPPPPPLGGALGPAPPAPVLAPSVAMEVEICPQIEAAIAEIPRMIASESLEEIVAVHDRFVDLPSRIAEVASSHEFGAVAAIEFTKGLELVRQATLAPPEQLEQLAEALDHAAELAEHLDAEAAPDADDEPPPPAFDPAPSPNPLPPPKPPPPP